jgi:hypothetical protein
MSTQLPFRISSRLIIYKFALSYIGVVLGYISGEMGFLISSIIFFGGGCLFLPIAEPRLSKRVSTALITIGLCLYAPAPYFLLRGYIRIRFDPQSLRELVLVVIAGLVLFFISLTYGIIRYKLLKRD